MEIERVPNRYIKRNPWLGIYAKPQEVFGTVLLENVDEIKVAELATRRALIRRRGSSGMFMSESPDSTQWQRHVVAHQTGILLRPHLNRLNAINFQASETLKTAAATDREDIPLYIWHTKHADTLLRALADIDSPERKNHPFGNEPDISWETMEYMKRGAYYEMLPAPERPLHA